MPMFYGLADWRHLKFDGNDAQLLYGACGADATISDEGRRLAIELLKGIIEEWHRVVAQVDNFHAEIGAPNRNFVKP